MEREESSVAAQRKEAGSKNYRFTRQVVLGAGRDSSASSPAMSGDSTGQKQGKGAQSQVPPVSLQIRQLWGHHSNSSQAVAWMVTAEEGARLTLAPQATFSRCW